MSVSGKARSGCFNNFLDCFGGDDCFGYVLDSYKNGMEDMFECSRQGAIWQLLMERCLTSTCNLLDAENSWLLK